MTEKITTQYENAIAQVKRILKSKNLEWQKI